MKYKIGDKFTHNSGIVLEIVRVLDDSYDTIGHHKHDDKEYNDLGERFFKDYCKKINTLESKYIL